MAHLIALCGEAAMRAMSLDQVFKALGERIESLDCQQKHGGLLVALNVIWYGYEELITKLFDFGLMRVLGEALEMNLTIGLKRFAIATMENHIDLRGLTLSQQDFMETHFIPFLNGCYESDETVLASQAEAFLCSLHKC
jgi:hypothetical protein